MKRIHVLVTAGMVMAGVLAASAQDGRLSRERLDQHLRGFVIPSKQVELASPLEDILVAVEVKEADRVKANQVLARMDSRVQQALVEAARVRADSNAQIDQATLDLEDAQMNFDRIKSAHERAGATDFERSRARIAVGQAKAALDAANEGHQLAAVNLRLEQERLSRYIIHAPFDGTVIQIIAETGARLTEVDKVLTLADLDTLEAHLNLPATMFGRLTVGETYTLLAQDPVNRELQARLATVIPIIDTASQTFRCVFTIENPQAELPAGFTVYLKWNEERGGSS